MGPKQLAMGGVAVMAILVLGGSTGANAAEVCAGTPNLYFPKPGGRICLLDPPSAAAPLAPFPTFQLRVPSEVNRIDASWRGSDESPYTSYTARMQVVAQGPPGGTSIWQGSIVPYLGTVYTASIPHDGTLDLSVKTSETAPPPAYNHEAETTTFAGLPVLGLVSGIGISVKRQGQRYVATYTAAVRAAAAAKVRMYISAPTKGEFDFPGKPTQNEGGSLGGAVQVTTKLSRRYVLNNCQRYRHCTLFAEGILTVPGLTSDKIGIGSHLKVK
jgi:hypothetical protein